MKASRPFAQMVLVAALVVILVLAAGCASTAQEDSGSTGASGSAASEAAASAAVDADALLTAAAEDGDYLADGSFVGVIRQDEDLLSYHAADSLSEDPLTWYLADFDGDGASELLIIQTVFVDEDEVDEGSAYPTEVQAELCLYEVDETGEVVLAASCTVDSGVVCDREEGTLLWAVYEQDGAVRIACESWSQASYLADGIALGFVAFAYDGEELSTVVAWSVSGSDFSGEVDGAYVEYDSAYVDELSAAGIEVDLGALVEREATICEDALGATVFCTSETELVLDYSEFIDWQSQAGGADDIEATSIQITVLAHGTE